MSGQSGNRLDVRVRGNAHQLHEKYKQMARDAHQAGDRVASEYYLQHADHYFRILNDGRQRQEEARGRRNPRDEEDFPEEEEVEVEVAPRPRSRRPARSREMPEGEATERATERAAERRGNEAVPEEALSDGEAALAAFGGADDGGKTAKPLVLDLGAEGPLGESEDARAEAAPPTEKPVRRRRTRKVAEKKAEPARDAQQPDSPAAAEG